MFFALSRKVLATERLCCEGWWELNCKYPWTPCSNKFKGLTSTHDLDVQQLNDKLYYTLWGSDATPATFWGFRRYINWGWPITSSMNCPTYKVSKHLASIPSPLKNDENTAVTLWEKSLFAPSTYRKSWSISTSYPFSHHWHSRWLRTADPKVTTGH